VLEPAGCHSERKVFKVRDGETIFEEQIEAVFISNGVNDAAGDEEKENRIRGKGKNGEVQTGRP
jgi:hypothetical protein